MQGELIFFSFTIGFFSALVIVGIPALAGILKKAVHETGETFND